MKIVVCIKQVPDTTEIRLDPVTGTLIRDGVPSIMNPDDKAGLEMALELKDQYGAHVTVITMGPPQADDILREAFAMGADRAIHLSDRKFAGADTLATSNAIAGALRMLEFDLVITGRQAIDGDTAQVGPQIAEHLGLPQVTYLEGIKYEGRKPARRQEMDGRGVSVARGGNPVRGNRTLFGQPAPLYVGTRHRGGIRQAGGSLGFRQHLRRRVETRPQRFADPRLQILHEGCEIRR